MKVVLILCLVALSQGSVGPTPEQLKFEELLKQLLGQNIIHPISELPILLNGAIARRDLGDLLNGHGAFTDLIEKEKELLAQILHVGKRNFFDTLKDGFEDLGHKITDFGKEALPVIEEVGKVVLPTVEKLAPELLAAGLTAAVGRRDLGDLLNGHGGFVDLIEKEKELLAQILHVGKRSFFDTLKHGFEDLGHKITDFGKEALPVLEEVGKAVLPTVEKLAPELLAAGLTAAVGRRGLSNLDLLLFPQGPAASLIEKEKQMLLHLGKRNFLDTLKHGFEDIGHKITDFGKEALPVLEEVGKAVLPTVEKLAPELLAAGLTAAVGRRDLLENLLSHEVTTTHGGPASVLLQDLLHVGKRNFLDTLKHGFEDLGHKITDFGKDALPVLEEVGKAVLPTVEKLAPELLAAGLTAAVGRRDLNIGMMGHVKEEVQNFVDKVTDSLKGAETITNNLKSNLEAASHGLANGQDIKDLAQMVLSTLEKDVGSMIEKGTFEVNLDKMIGDIIPNAAEKFLTKHSKRGLLGDLLNGFKDTLGDTVGLLSGTAFGDLKSFLGGVVSSTQNLLSPSLGNLKNLAQAFLGNAGQATAKVAMEAVKFFEPFKTQLGSVFTQIENVAHSLVPQ